MIRRSIIGTLFAAALAMTATAEAAVVEAISSLDRPVRLVAPEGDARLFVAQRAGLVRVFDQQGVQLDTYLDLTGQTTTEGERGLLGLAFAPDYATSGRCYVCYTDLAGDLNVARFTVSAGDPDQADAASQEVILTVAQPGTEHNGGHIEFGPDGMLYVSLGDGEYGNDPGNRAQDMQQLLGKMLRLDVSGATGYAIPADNPYVGSAPLDEIWSTGLRNPWGFSFDRLTGDLYITDVGEDQYEEINIQPAGSDGGENWGWRLMEGPNCHVPSSGCEGLGLDEPAYAYTHSGGSLWRCAIAGGYVYRGSNLPSLQGRFFFSDYCSRQIWSLDWTESGGVGTVIDHSAEMSPPLGYQTVASLGQDGFGELYVLDYDGGSAFRIIGATSPVPDAANTARLAQNAPNPFNPRTDIAYAVDRSDLPTRLEVFDAAGRLVRTLVDEVLVAGEYVASWNGTDAAGRPVPSGVYLYRLRNGDVDLSRKMLLLE
ncbi:PQQ-dependent sugar dehydrogenase [bacterium]|nr:PQQ-dependent sugar dehydrogenase [bacterium]